jgi:hypothetical protein
MVSTLDLPEHFVFHTFTNAILSGSTSTSGLLSLKCISRALILQIGTSETPMEPFRTVLYFNCPTTQPDASTRRIYRFLTTPSDPTELELTIDFSPDPDAHPALEMFNNILEQYFIDFKRISPPSSVLPSSSSPQTFKQDKIYDSNLRNHLFLVNEETGQLLAQFKDDTYHIQRNLSTHQVGCEDEPIVIVLDGKRKDEDISQALMKVVPPGQQSWIIKSASAVGYASTSVYYFHQLNPFLIYFLLYICVL